MIVVTAVTNEDTLVVTAQKNLCAIIAASPATFLVTVRCQRRHALSATRQAILHSTAGLTQAGTRSAISATNWVTCLVTAVTQLPDLRTSAINVHDLGTLPGTVVAWSIATSVMGKVILLRTVTQPLVNQIATIVRSRVILPGTALKSRVFATHVKSPATSARSVLIVMQQRILM